MSGTVRVSAAAAVALALTATAAAGHAQDAGGAERARDAGAVAPSAVGDAGTTAPPPPPVGDAGTTAPPPPPPVGDAGTTAPPPPAGDAGAPVRPGPDAGAWEPEVEPEVEPGGEPGNAGEPLGAGEDEYETGEPVAEPSGGEAAEGEEEPAEGAAGAAAVPEPPAPTVPPEQLRLLGPSQGELPERDTGGTRRFLLPPYLHEWGRGYRSTVLFPFYFNVHRGEEHAWVIGPYYRLRTPRVRGDVVFPFFASYDGREADGTRWSTHVIPPAYYHASRGPERAHAASLGAAPLFFYGETFGRNGRLQHEHLIIPPLLTYHRWWPTGQTTVAGPYIYVRNRSAVHWALVPFAFGHASPQVTWTVLPPLLSYRRVDHENNRTFTVAGPYFSDVGPDSASYNLAPLFFHYHDRERSRTTVAPLFHTESGRDRFSLFTPLGGYARSGRDTTVVLPFYQGHRGATQLDALLPLPFFWSRDPRRGVSTLSAGLLAFHTQSPTGYAWAFFPLAARFREYGRYDTVATPMFVHSSVPARRATVTWIFPAVHAETWADGSLLNIYPLLWSARGRDWHHSVFFPLFANIGNRTTGQEITLTPVFGRVRTRTSMTQWVFPFNLYWEQTRLGERSFGWDVFPFVQYGRPRPGDEYWSVLHGLVGYRRQGSYEQLRLLWIPIGLRGTPPAAPAPTRGDDAQEQARSRRGGDADVRLEL